VAVLEAAVPVVVAVAAVVVVAVALLRQQPLRRILMRLLRLREARAVRVAVVLAAVALAVVVVDVAAVAMLLQARRQHCPQVPRVIPRLMRRRQRQARPWWLLRLRLRHLLPLPMPQHLMQRLRPLEPRWLRLARPWVLGQMSPVQWRQRLMRPPWRQYRLAPIPRTTFCPTV
jgi:hypothetical protein